MIVLAVLIINNIDNLNFTLYMYLLYFTLLLYDNYN